MHHGEGEYTMFWLPLPVASAILCYSLLEVTTKETSMDMRQMTLAVVGHYQDQRGVLAYRLLEAVQSHLFPDDALPWPLLLWGLTPHGKCLGWTRSSTQHDPIILLHPSLLEPAIDRMLGTYTNPWGMQAAWCGITMV